MPSLVIHSSLTPEQIPEKFLSQTTEFMAELCDKPVERIRVRNHPDQAMCIAGNEDPGCLVTFSNVGQFDETQNKKFAGEITSFITRHLKIPTDRIFIHFYEQTKDMVATGGVLLCDK